MPSWVTKGAALASLPRVDLLFSPLALVPRELCTQTSCATCQLTLPTDEVVIVGAHIGFNDDVVVTAHCSQECANQRLDAIATEVQSNLRVQIYRRND